jgi:hypothetical protein
MRVKFQGWGDFPQGVKVTFLFGLPLTPDLHTGQALILSRKGRGEKKRREKASPLTGEGRACPELDSGMRVTFLFGLPLTPDWHTG